MTNKLDFITKRDGRKVAFNAKKITDAIYGAFCGSGEIKSDKKKLSEARRLTPIAVDLFKRTINGNQPTVETMQNVVEQVLMAARFYKTAKSYILYREEREQQRRQKQSIGVTDDLKLSINQLKVMESRYLRKDEEGKIMETPKQMFRRVARAVAANEKTEQKEWERKFYQMMSGFEYIPAGGYLRTAGTEKPMIANCFVLPVEDSMEGIFDSVKWMALVHQKGGGTGFNFSKLRPKGDSVISSNGVSSGPISFMKVFDAATRQVMQGGFKRGANMGILNIDHPDILDFINCKSEESEINNFNISVGITDKFMQAVKEDGNFDLINPRDKSVVQTVPARNLFDQIVNLAWRTGDPGVIFLDAINRTNPVKETLGEMITTNPCITGDTLIATDKGLISFKELYEEQKLVNIAVDNRSVGKTGVSFNKTNKIIDQGKKQVFKLVTKSGFEIKTTADHKFLTTNGWMELQNLTDKNFVLVQTGKGKFIKNEKLKSFLYLDDQVLKIEKLDIEQVYDLTEEKTHSFIANGFVVHNCGEQPLHPFDVCNLGSINLSAFVSEEKKINWKRLNEVIRLAVRFQDNGVDISSYPLGQIEEMAKNNRRIGLGVMGFADMLYKLGITYNSEEGVQMAGRVMNFIYTISHNESEILAEEKGNFPNWKGSEYEKKGIKQRNLAITTIAPTGTISMVAECSSGIEPVFLLSYIKNVVSEDGLSYVNPVFRQILTEQFHDEEQIEEIINKINKIGSCREIDEIPEEIKKVFVTAHDISWQDHVAMQAAFQMYTDNAVSKTINFPHQATIMEVEQAYMMAWEMGCKGLTIYRDGSKSFQILQSHGEKKAEGKEPVIQSKIVTKTLKERFSKNVEGRMQNVENINTEIKNSHSTKNSQDKQRQNNKIKTDNIESKSQHSTFNIQHSELCPECGAELQMSEGCCLCLSCGYSKCSL